jgi:hypothetical protein
VGGDSGDGLEDLAELVQGAPERVGIPSRRRDRGTGRFQPVKRFQTAGSHSWIADRFQLGPQLSLRMRPHWHSQRPHKQALVGQLGDQLHWPGLERWPAVAALVHLLFRFVKIGRHAGRVTSGRDPPPDAGIFGQDGRQRVDRPHLETGHPCRQQLCAWFRHHRRTVIGQLPPAKRAEEPDRVVLGAVALPVARHRLQAAPVRAPRGRC